MLLLLSSCVSKRTLEGYLQRNMGRSDVGFWLVEQMEREVNEMRLDGLTEDQIKTVWFDRARRYFMWIYDRPESERRVIVHHLKINPETDIRLMIKECVCKL